MLVQRELAGVVLVVDETVAVEIGLEDDVRIVMTVCGWFIVAISNIGSLVEVFKILHAQQQRVDTLMMRGVSSKARKTMKTNLRIRCDHLPMTTVMSSASNPIHVSVPCRQDTCDYDSL